MDNQKREKKCSEMAQEIIKIIAKNELKLGKLNNEDKYKYFDPIAKEVLNLMLERNILYLEKDFVFQLVLQAIEETRQKVVNSLYISYEVAVKKFFDGKDIVDLTLSDINAKLLDVEIKQEQKQNWKQKLKNWFNKS